VRANDEELVELGDFEDLANLRIDGAQDQFAARPLDLLVQGDQLAQGGTRHVLDIAEIQEQLLASGIVHQAEELFADDLDVLLVENLLVREANNRHIANVFDFESPSTRRLRRRHKGGPLLSPSLERSSWRGLA